MNIFNSIFLIILLISSYTDIKTRIISNKLMIVSFIIGIILNILYTTSFYIILSLILYIIFLFSPIKGGGDVKLLSISILYIRENTSSFFCILGFICLVILIYFKIKNKKITSIPLAPYILTGYVINLITISLL